MKQHMQQLHPVSEYVFNSSRAQYSDIDKVKIRQLQFRF